MHQPISSLNLPDFKIQELQTVGYHYCTDANKSEKKFASKIQISQWDDLVHTPKTRSALDIYQEECVSGTILTSSKELDEALGGGIPVGLITEFCGEPGCGKTQVCFHLCVNVQLPLWCGGMAGQSIYISTNKGFASHRLREIATACVNNYLSFKAKHCILATSNNDEFCVQSIMRNIRYIGINSHVELVAAFKCMRHWLQENLMIRLVVIDSISAPLKKTEFKERTQMLYNICNDLQILAQQFKFAIIFTNDMTTRITSANSPYHTPSLGDSYYHRINVRVQLSKKD
ncbi:hypothetical protein ILUMI_25570 [Ignelater luminosus]|uniref:DNA repair protein RAD51 homolog 3 n=1 Tax=Ignelater luminosus TaxID=2038154 RepID=A0A8K0FZJ2_IGNLU|nr:hypothetical protein ILUMI_25570 [Ignelater luminosus]